jgi:hypothetical protein
LGQGLKKLASKQAGRYSVACGRIVGRSHIAAQVSCQDFVSVRRSASMACIALADGAGSRERSEVGAEVVVRTTLRLLTAQFDETYAMCVAAEESARRHIHDRLLESLRRAASRHGCDVRALASTLLFVAHKGDRFLAGHIGDGLIAQIDEGGKPHTLSPPDNGEFANTTVFVPDPIAVERFRLFYGGPEQSASGYVVMSDGCAESLYDKRTGTPAPAISKLFSWNQELSRSKMDGILAANLQEAFSKKSADDCSLALLSVRRR